MDFVSSLESDSRSLATVLPRTIPISPRSLFNSLIFTELKDGTLLDWESDDEWEICSKFDERHVGFMEALKSANFLCKSKSSEWCWCTSKFSSPSVRKQRQNRLEDRRRWVINKETNQ